MVYQERWSPSLHAAHPRLTSTYLQREFQLYYQPIVSLETNRLYSFETVLCLRPERAQLYSIDALAFIENSQLDVPLHQWVCYEACQQMKSWQISCATDIPLHLSINLSPKQLQYPYLAEQITEMIHIARITPTHLQLEIPAQWLLENQSEAQSIIRRLKKIGVSICIDNLSSQEIIHRHWKRLPVSALKISQAYAWQIARDSELRNCFKKTISISNKTHTQIIFKDIESTTQLNTVKTLGCTYGQGKLLSKPLSPRQTTTLIASQSKKQPKELLAYLMVMSILSRFAQKFLGSAVVTRYWQETRPQKPWIALIHPHTRHQFVIQSMRSKKLNIEQQQDLRYWIYQFVERCDQIINNFPQLLAQSKLTSPEKKLLRILCPFFLLN